MDGTSQAAPPPLLSLLAHDIRWQLLRALATSDYRVHELVDLVGRPLNLVSYHLRQLHAHNLVTERRSSADGRDVYYHLDLDRLHTHFLASGEALHPALTNGHVASGLAATVAEVSGAPPARILFLCTNNSARSQMAEAIARHIGKGRIEAWSAGSAPSTIHPDAVSVLADMHIDIGHQTSKHLDAFRGEPFDYIITVCDRARESCPVFPGDPLRIHWSFPDPSAIAEPLERYRQFQAIARELVTRLRHLLVVIDSKRNRS